ncbi:NADH:ubiquinone reductase (Na(+)-transporting) subunit C [bacterium B17]|nr:NADH:ubiquinone reductase (Na(+)-transporting) subunit C [bacterium B17]
MGEQLKTIGFAAAVCLVCSLLLAAVYSGLREEQEQNKANELKVKVLTAFGKEIIDGKGKLAVSQEQVDEMFKAEIVGKVLDGNGELVESITVEALAPEQINNRNKETGLKEYYPFYIHTDPATSKKRYAIHLSGMGLWSVVKAYLALEDDYNTIAGMAFYDHAETPGLGGEIEKDFFQDRFKEKKMLEGDVVKGFQILKPGMQTDDYCIDGISGATMTCKGIANFINSDFAVYNKYFSKLRQK